MVKYRLCSYSRDHTSKFFDNSTENIKVFFCISVVDETSCRHWKIQTIVTNEKNLKYYNHVIYLRQINDESCQKEIVDIHLWGPEDIINETCPLEAICNGIDFRQSHNTAVRKNLKLKIEGENIYIEDKIILHDYKKYSITYFRQEDCCLEIEQAKLTLPKDCLPFNRISSLMKRTNLFLNEKSDKWEIENLVECEPHQYIFATDVELEVRNHSGT